MPHLKLRVERAEPPSLHLAFGIAMQLLGQRGARLSLSVDHPERPCLDEKGESSWEFSGSHPRPRCMAPPLEVIASIASIAETEFTLDAYIAKAASVRASTDALAAAGFHAPLPRDSRVAPMLWVFRFQVAAALALAASQAVWSGSERRRRLYELASGYVDWTSAAAMIALGVVARQSDDARSEVELWFSNWLRASDVDAPYGYTPYLIAAWMQLPGLRAETRAQLWQRRVAARNVDIS